jgi:aminoglycoside 3-N-acetyltransferase I
MSTNSEQHFTIRKLGPDDSDMMYELLSVFGEAFQEAGIYGAARPTRDYLRHLLAGDLFIALAALVDREIVGGLAAYVLPKFEQERSEIYIYDLAVAIEYRRQGIATALIQEIREIAALRGSYVVFVQADHGDTPAISLYTKLGKCEDVLHFDIEPKSS